MTRSDGDEGGGWPDVVGDTALSIRVPEADPLVRTGSSAHITVLYPFLHVSRLGEAVHRELAALFAAHGAFTLSFEGFGRYPGVLYLDPLPKDPVEALTKEVTRAWPEAEPYRGIFDGGLEPHLTVAVSEAPHGDDAAHEALAARFGPLLPISAEVTEVGLVVWDGSGWRERVSYPLGRPEG
ncbi:2'-5' RNA ligase superfamily protein [Streptomyces sp. WMMB 714]|jgi:2'-5' RNA ligase|uniref:2'-5' RNA ligase family protein n=1 Tax=Streptomyces sp. WMMB 714 TaxID=1286822 RepID=UPI0005F81BC2|nr:2'-5' RNA ligase family protein [Streptomyces sp. WMMB 714]SCK54011.1 2'-5' RNA ligase superfamily protein [Streptomyces sp. WMMB 714]